VAVGVGGRPNSAQYLPPVFAVLDRFILRRTRSFRSHSTLPCESGVDRGALVTLVRVQLCVLRSCRPPVFNLRPLSSNPPQTIISVPVQER